MATYLTSILQGNDENWLTRRNSFDDEAERETDRDLSFLDVEEDVGGNPAEAATAAAAAAAAGRIAKIDAIVEAKLGELETLCGMAASTKQGGRVASAGLDDSVYTDDTVSAKQIALQKRSETKRRKEQRQRRAGRTDGLSSDEESDSEDSDDLLDMDDDSDEDGPSRKRKRHRKRKAIGASGGPTSVKSQARAGAHVILDESMSVGLSDALLTRLVSLITSDASPELGGQAVSTLLQAANPRGPMPSSLAVNITAALPRWPASVQRTAAAWICVHFEQFDSRPALGRLTAVFLHWMRLPTLRPYLAHVLVRCMRRSDVTAVRVRKLQRYSATDETGGVDAVLSVVASFYPAWVSVPRGAPQSNLARSRQNPWKPKASERLWAQRAQSVVREATKLARALGTAPPTTPKAPQLRSDERMQRAVRAEVVPGATFGAIAKASGAGPTDVSRMQDIRKLATTLADGSTARSLAVPTRTASILGSRQLQHQLMLTAPRSVAEKLAYWIRFVFSEELVNRASDVHASRRVRLLLEACVSFARFCGETHPALTSFVASLLRMSPAAVDPLSVSDEASTLLRPLLQLIALSPPQAFEDLYANYLRVLGRVADAGSVGTKAAIIDTLRVLVTSWARVDYRPARDVSSAKGRFVLNRLEGNVDYYRSLRELMSFSMQLGAMQVMATDDHTLVSVAAHRLSAACTTAHTRFGVPFVVLPPVSLVYRPLYSLNVVDLSLAAGVLGALRREFESLKKQDAAMDGDDYGLSFRNGIEFIRDYNAFVWNYCSALWREKTFAPTADDPDRLTDTLGLTDDVVEKLLATGYTQRELAATLSISSSLTFVGQLQVYMDEGNDHPSQDKVHFLDWLAERYHMAGLSNFLYSFIGVLVTKRKRQQRRA